MSLVNHGALRQHVPGLFGIVGPTHVRTDLRAGTDFERVRVVLAPTEREATHNASRLEDYVAGQQVAIFEGLDPGDYTVSVELIDQALATVVAREVDVTVRQTVGLVVPLSRDCIGVDCSDEMTCHGGSCVSSQCSSLNGEACGTPECNQASDCAFAFPCLAPICHDRIANSRPNGLRLRKQYVRGHYDTGDSQLHSNPSRPVPCAHRV